MFTGANVVQGCRFFNGKAGPAGQGGGCWPQPRRDGEVSTSAWRPPPALPAPNALQCETRKGWSIPYQRKNREWSSAYNVTGLFQYSQCAWEIMSLNCFWYFSKFSVNKAYTLGHLKIHFRAGSALSRETLLMLRFNRNTWETTDWKCTVICLVLKFYMAT